VTRYLVRIVTLAMLLSATACVSVRTPSFLTPAPRREWKTTVERAQSLAAAGRAAEADSILANYAASYPKTPGARETLYWRSLIQLQSGLVSENGPAMMLGQYINERDAEHAIEAVTLRRVATRVDSLARAANTLTSKVQISNGEVVSAKSDTKAVIADNKDQDAEIKRLKGELAAAKEELERIKKRLAEPPKKPPAP
jgi:hypothetical protein